MSKLADLLTRVSRGPQTRMGFGPRSTDQVPPLLLLASGEARALPAETAGRVDAFLVTQGPTEPPAAESLVWGAQASTAETGPLREAGGDFLAFEPAQAPASVLNEETLGKVLMVDPEASDTVLRATDALPIDATLLDLTDGALTVERLMSAYRVAGLVRKPLIVVAEPSWGRDELVALRDAGALGVLVRLPVAEGTIARLHDIIGALPPRKRPRPRGEALLPAMREEQPTALPPEIEEPDEDDDD